MSSGSEYEFRRSDSRPSGGRENWRGNDDNNRYKRDEYDNRREGCDNDGNRRGGYDDYGKRPDKNDNRRSGYNDEKCGDYEHYRSSRHGGSGDSFNYGRKGRERHGFNEDDRPRGRGIIKSYRPACSSDTNNRYESYDKDFCRDADVEVYDNYGGNDEGYRDSRENYSDNGDNRGEFCDNIGFRDNDKWRSYGEAECHDENRRYGDHTRADGNGTRNNRGRFRDRHERGRIIRGSSGNGERDSRGCFKCGGPHLARDCMETHNRGLGDNKKKPVTYIPDELIYDEDQMFDTIGKGINFDKYEDIPVDVSGENPPHPISSFDECDIEEQLKRNVRKAKYDKPTPIQKWAIPIILAGRDLMGCAQTGSGKTAGFLLPVLTGLIKKGEIGDNSRGPAPVALIVGPTRELVMQIYEETRKFSIGLPIKSVVVYGGVSVAHHINRLSQGVDIVIATVGRLLDFVKRGIISLNRVRYLVLDEADRMLDMGFKDDILKLCFDFDMPQKADRQTLLFSATFPEEIQNVAASVLEYYLFLAVGRVGGANQDIEQVVELVPLDKKKERLIQILKSQPEDLKTIVFVEKKVMSDFLAVILSQVGLRSTSIHGDREQREREEALRTLKNGKTPIIVATSVAARGLDIPGIGHVINYDLPKNIDEYVHRIGRTGRCGNIGMATSFYNPTCDSGLARDLENILVEVHQQVPKWLQDSCSMSGEYSSGYTPDVRYEPAGGRGHQGVENEDQHCYRDDEGEEKESWR